MQTTSATPTAETRVAPEKNVIKTSTMGVAKILRNLNEARKSFVKYAKENFPKSVRNSETQKDIAISRTGIDKFLSGNISKEKYATGRKIPALIESATKVGEAGNKKDKPGITGYEYFRNSIKIDDVDYAVHIRVRNTNMGDKYYGHTISREVDDIKIKR